MHTIATSPMWHDTPHFILATLLTPQHTYLVSIRPLQDEEVWLDLSEGMSQVATDFVVQTGCLFVLTPIE